jgi:tetratricopeptide (TPR) repeat protein
MTTPSGGITPAGTQPVAAVSAEQTVRQAHPVRVAGLFGLACIGALAVVYFLLQLFGLPDWVFYGAIVLLGIGFPIMLLTGHHERRRAIARTTGMLTVTPAGGVRRHFTWRKSLLGGALAFAGLGVFAGGYMALRAMGIGPAGTLITTGVLEERDRLILADFANFSEDTTLGRSVTEAFRIDLAQSLVLTLMGASDISGVLERMDREASTRLDQYLAREVAQREGVKAFVTGEISTLGDGYVLSATLVSSAEGDVLEALRETADDRSEIIGAVDRLSAKLRERIGESLRTIRANPPLDRVTTRSLEALEKYSRSLQAEQEGEMDRSITLLQEAIALDSAFAMAYRRLGVVVRLAGGDASRHIDATTKAFEYRDRLPDIERYLAEAYYFSQVQADFTQSARAYRSLLELDPYYATALNNLAALEGFAQRWPEAEELALRGLEISDLWQLSENAAWAQVAQGKFTEARTTIERLAETSPDSPRVPQYMGLLHSVEGQYDSARVHFTALAAKMRGSPVWQSISSNLLASLAQLQGKLDAAEGHIAQSMRAALERGQPADYLRRALQLSWLDLLYREDPAGGIQRLDAALAEQPLADMPGADRPYLALAEFLASANQPARARALLTEYEEVNDEQLRRRDAIDPQRRPGSATVALAEGQVEEAIANFRRRSDTGCAPCGLFGLAQAFEAAGQSDSALAVYERRIRTPGLYKVYLDAGELAPTYRRLGELYEERGDRERAIEHYNNFVELWSAADPELQDQVREVRERIARLISET